MSDHYQVLGVKKDASTAQIREAYLRLAREHHPDRFADPAEKARAQELFTAVTAAFNTLSNERSRREYDVELEKPKLSSPEQMGQSAYSRGVERFEARDYHEAVNLFRSASHYLPQEPVIHAALARALFKNPNWAREAIESMDKATQLAPKNGLFQAELAYFLHSQGLRLRSRKALDAALRLAPQDPEVQRIASEIGDDAESGAPRSGGGLWDRLKRKG